jgi:hypothetical protein
MATVSIDGDTLDISVEGLDKLWTLKSRLSIPLAHVRGATADPGIVGEPKGWRGPGTHLPSVIVAGNKEPGTASGVGSPAVVPGFGLPFCGWLPQRRAPKWPTAQWPATHTVDTSLP